VRKQILASLCIGASVIAGCAGNQGASSVPSSFSAPAVSSRTTADLSASAASTSCTEKTTNFTENNTTVQSFVDLPGNVGYALTFLIPGPTQSMNGDTFSAEIYQTLPDGATYSYSYPAGSFTIGGSLSGPQTGGSYTQTIDTPYTHSNARTTIVAVQSDYWDAFQWSAQGTIVESCTTASPPPPTPVPTGQRRYPQPIGRRL
jgi:hypothetical protein